MNEETIEEGRETLPRRAQHGVEFARRALKQLIPFFLGLRRRRRVWNALRAAVAVLGAILVVVPLGISANWYAAVIGLVLFLTAMLVPPPKPGSPVDDPARASPILK